MKLISAALLTSFLAPKMALANEQTTCLLKQPDIYLAIEDFCGKNNIVVPSAYGNVGKRHGSKCESKDVSWQRLLENYC
jgi:hypothetical protein